MLTLCHRFRLVQATIELLDVQSQLRRSKLTVMEEFLSLTKENFSDTFRRIQRADAQTVPLSRQIKQLEAKIKVLSETIDITELLVQRLVELFDAAQDFSHVSQVHSALYPVSIDAFSNSARDSIRARLRAMRKQQRLDEEARDRAREKEGLDSDGALPRLKRKASTSEDVSINEDDDLNNLKGNTSLW